MLASTVNYLYFYTLQECQPYLDRFKHTTPNHNTTTIKIMILTAQPIISPKSAVELKPGNIQY